MFFKRVLRFLGNPNCDDTIHRCTSVCGRCCYLIPPFDIRASYIPGTATSKATGSKFVLANFPALCGVILCTVVTNGICRNQQHFFVGKKKLIPTPPKAKPGYAFKFPKAKLRVRI